MKRQSLLLLLLAWAVVCGAQVRRRVVQTDVIDTIVTTSQDTIYMKHNDPVVTQRTIPVVAKPATVIAPSVPAADAPVYTDQPQNRAWTPRTEIGEKIQGRLHRVDREIQRSIFVPKGTWMGGFQVSYGNNKLENINMLVLKDVDFSNTTFGLSPCVAYFFRNNTCAGLRYNYSYSRLNLNKLDLNLGEDFNISLRDLYYLEKASKVSLFLRNYVPLSRSKIFAYFSEVQLSYGHSEGKNSSGQYEAGTLDATYAKTNSAHIGFAPGITAFVQDWMAIEIQAGVVGFGFNWQDQTHNQVEQGRVRSFSGKFKVDLFSISIGTTIYL